VTLHEQPKAHPRGKHRVMVIGLDSVDPDLVLRWSQEGRLPFLHSLMQSGVWTRLISTHDIFNDSPWPTFNTGVSPGKHGFYNHIQFRRGTTEIFRSDARSCYYLPFWWLLRGAGKKVAVFDVPKTYPLPGIEGQSYILAGNEPVTFAQFVNLIAQELGVELLRGCVIPGPFRAFHTLAEKIFLTFGVEIRLAHRYELFFTDEVFQIVKARQELGYEPTTSVGAGVRQMVRWYRDHGDLPTRQP
jgi:type I phosphodiesterase/nucleotide pyrophosphatase